MHEIDENHDHILSCTLNNILLYHVMKINEQLRTNELLPSFMSFWMSLFAKVGKQSCNDTTQIEQ